jgi:hypothetical protein
VQDWVFLNRQNFPCCRDHVALIVPFRNRYTVLSYFLTDV